MKRTRLIRIGWAAGMALLLLGCARTLTSHMLVPAAAEQVARLQRVAVLPLDGRAGRRESLMLEAMIARIEVDGHPYFKVFERERLAEVLKEQKLGLTGLIDPGTAARIHALTGIQGFIAGQVDYDVDDERYREKREKCVKKGKKGKCKEEREYSVGCTRRTARYTLTPKLIDAISGAICFSEVVVGEADDAACRDAGTPLASEESLIDQARQAAFDRFHDLIAPHYEKISVTLLTEDNSRMAPDIKTGIENGIQWAEEDRLDRAIEIWQALYRQHPDGYALPYLIGVGHELSGEPEIALSYYEQADHATPRPVAEINAALDRVRRRLEERALLEKQLRK